MKKICLILLTVLSFSGFAQNDTLLYNTFNLFDIDTFITEGNDTIPYLDLDESVWVNLELQGWQTFSNKEQITTQITSSAEGENYYLYEEGLWDSWHIHSYLLDSVDTIVEVDTTIYDTLADFGLASYSWLELPNRLQNAFMTPPVFLSGNQSTLRWKSMPMQGPRHQDGYKVYVLDGGYHKIDEVKFNELNYDFAMKELDVTNASPPKYLTSLHELQTTFDFVPLDGSDHINYALKDTTEEGIVDSTLQQPYMQEFELDLSGYVDRYVQVVFLHDSYDNYGIVFDDVLITGSGSIGVEKVQKGQARVYPNPVQNELFIELDKTFYNAELRVYDVKGQEVVSQLYNSFQSVNTAQLSPGQYFIQLTTEESIYTQSFIKTK